MARAYHRKPLAERFWAKVRRTDDCWIWMGARNSAGYGNIGDYGDGRKVVLTHRLSMALSGTAIPIGMQVLHRCDNPPCVNPGHLFVGTALDNSRDMITKGRHSHGDEHTKRLRLPRGEHHANARLTDAAVCEIRTSQLPVKTLAEKFGVVRTVIYKVLRREIWAHV